jgi:hypothetical protein
LTEKGSLRDHEVNPTSGSIFRVDLTASELVDWASLSRFASMHGALSADRVDTVAPFLAVDQSMYIYESRYLSSSSCHFESLKKTEPWMRQLKSGPFLEAKEHYTIQYRTR